jgi:hypothetical protein
MLASVAVGTAQILTGSAAEGREVIERVRREAEANHWLNMRTATDGPLGVAMVLNGEVGAGIRWLSNFVRNGQVEPGTRNTGELAALALADIYISLREGGRRMPLAMLIRNLVPIIRAWIKAPAEAEHLLDDLARSPFYDPNSIFHARIAFHRGRLCALRKRPSLAREHFERARTLALGQNAEILCAKIDAALAAL